MDPSIRKRILDPARRLRPHDVSYFGEDTIRLTALGLRAYRAYGV